jgi:two-component system, LytTR family, response regulator
MKYLNAVIVDDEETGRINLFGLVKKYCPDVKVIAGAGTVNEAVEKIRLSRPDLVFLDVELSPGSGFDILERLSPISFDIIFTTAFNQYAVKAFKYAAVDYLLKPIDIDELTEAVGKVVKRKDRASAESGPRIVLPDNHGFVLHQVNEIIRCQADSNYTRFFFVNRPPMIISKALKKFEDILTPFNFFRIHQSHLVNLSHLKSFDRRQDKVQMSDGETIEVSRRKRAEFIQEIYKRHF